MRCLEIIDLKICFARGPCPFAVMAWLCRWHVFFLSEPSWLKRPFQFHETTVTHTVHSNSTRRLLVVQFMSSHAEQIMRLQTLKDRVMIQNEVEHSQRRTHAHTRHSASCLLWCTLCPRTLKGWLNVIRFIMRTYENPQDVIFLGGLFYIWHSTALI